MKRYGGSGVIASRFLTSALDGAEWSISRHGRLISWERDPGTNWIGDWMGPKAGLGAVVKRKTSLLPELESRCPYSGTFV
jgi:hypothetical protein